MSCLSYCCCCCCSKWKGKVHKALAFIHQARQPWVLERMKIYKSITISVCVCVCERVSVPGKNYTFWGGKTADHFSGEGAEGVFE